MIRKKLSLASSGKKGNVILDGIMVLIVVFLFVLFTVIGYQVFNDVNTDIQNDDDLGNTTKELSGDLNTKYPSVMDGAFIFMLILLWGFVIVASFVVDSHPIFFIFTLILLMALLFIGGTLTNTYEETVDSGDFGSVNTSFPKIDFIMGHLIETILIMAFSVIIALYSKSQGGI